MDLSSNCVGDLVTTVSGGLESVDHTDVDSASWRICLQLSLQEKSLVDVSETPEYLKSH